MHGMSDPGGPARIKTTTCCQCLLCPVVLMSFLCQLLNWNVTGVTDVGGKKNKTGSDSAMVNFVLLFLTALGLLNWTETVWLYLNNRWWSSWDNCKPNGWKPGCWVFISTTLYYIFLVRSPAVPPFPQSPFYHHKRNRCMAQEYIYSNHTHHFSPYLYLN